MLRGIYSAASGMLANQRRSEALTNNLANLNANGYKADETLLRSFPEHMISEIHRIQQPAAPGVAPTGPNGISATPIGTLSNGVYTHEMIPNFRQGDLFETGNPLDLAIHDENLAPVEIDGKEWKPRLFFAIQRDGETSYTRNGNFTLDAGNRLVTGNGSFVLDVNGEIITLPSDEFSVDAKGNLIDADQNIIPLGLIQVNDPNQLVKTENGAFRWQGEGEPQPADREQPGFSLHQGFVERSNVDPQQTMIEMMETVRLFELNQKTLTAYNQTLDKLYDSTRLG